MSMADHYQALFTQVNGRQEEEPIWRRMPELVTEYCPLCLNDVPKGTLAATRVGDAVMDICPRCAESIRRDREQATLAGLP